MLRVRRKEGRGGRRAAAGSGGRNYRATPARLATGEEEPRLKRTRRIEVIRYSRRVTLRGGEGGAVPDAGAKADAVALLLEAAAAEAAPEADCVCVRTQADAGPPVHARGPLLRLLKRLWRD